MRPNASQFPNMHGYALERLEELNHPLIPKLYYYDDEEYECEFIDGKDLETYIRKTGNYQVGLEVMNQVQDLLYKMSKQEFNFEFPYSHKLNWRLGAEDIHSKNILITEQGQAYLIDLDQIGWWHPFTVFKLMNNAVASLSDSLRYPFLLWSNDGSYEAGVRHGFWNVKTKEEIKEKYEKHKHLEEWNKRN